MHAISNLRYFALRQKRLSVTIGDDIRSIGPTECERAPTGFVASGREFSSRLKGLFVLPAAEAGTVRRGCVGDRLMPGTCSRHASDRGNGPDSNHSRLSHRAEGAVARFVRAQGADPVADVPRGSCVLTRTRPKPNLPSAIRSGRGLGHGFDAYEDGRTGEGERDLRSIAHRPDR